MSDAATPPSKPVAPLAAEEPRAWTWGPLGGLLRSMAAAPPDRVALAFVVAAGASMLLPMLGTVGLYDPWETHYAEVGREMVARDDYVHPHWKDHYFFSKPVLLFWLSAVGFKVLDLATGGGVSGRGNMPELTELVVRLPIALIALLCLVCVYRVVNRFFGRTAGVLSAVALITMPFFSMVGRQHITDMPFVGLATAGICLMMESFFGSDEEADTPVGPLFLSVLAAVTLPQYLQICRSTQLLQGHPEALRYAVFAGSAVALAGVGMMLQRFGRDSRAHFFYLLCALATLAKGLAGVLLPGLVFLLYLGTSWEWWRLRRIRVLTGAVVTLMVAAPWFVVLSLFTGKDDESKTFFQRFWIHDHLNRMTGGVHGERGTFEYYIKQLGIGTVPWVGMLPFAWLHAASPAETVEETRRKVMRFIALWALACFALFSLSTTKFHHYILPMVPPLAMCAGIFMADLWERRRNPPVLVVLAMVVGNVVLASDMARNPYMVVDLFTYHYVSYKPDYYFPRDWDYGPAIGITLGVASALAALGAALGYASDIREVLGRKARGATEILRWVVAELVEAVLWLGELAVSLIGRNVPAGRAFVGFACTAGMVVGFFFTQTYYLKLAPHWSQRWLFNTYFSMKQGDEPIIAYLMNWRGETFYAKTLDAQINDGNQLKNRVKQPGREFILVETTRYKNLESVLGEMKDKMQIVDRSNAKWFLVLVDD